jgi:hypothetical protein
MIIPVEISGFEACRKPGISRRDCMQYCAAVTAALALASPYSVALAPGFGTTKKTGACIT